MKKMTNIMMMKWNNGRNDNENEETNEERKK